MASLDLRWLAIVGYSRRSPPHPAWCERRYCKGIEHVSRRFRVTGDVPLFLELIQHVDERVPRVSIMERDGRGVVTISARQTRVLAGVLSRLPAAQIDQV